MKKFIVLSIVLLIIAGFVITSSAWDVPLMAGKNIYIGKLSVAVDGDYLVVTYIMDPVLGWELGETHLYVGNVAPTKSAPGQFPYGPEDAVDGVYTIPLTDFGKKFPVCIAAHAEVTNQTEEETAWAGSCYRIRPNKNWAGWFYFSPPSP